MRLGLAGFAVALGACTAPMSDGASSRIAVGGSSPLVATFAQVAAESGVPAELLATIAYVQTRLRVVDGSDHGDHGAPASGILGLSDADLARGAQLAGVTDGASHTIEGALRSGAALIRANAPSARSLAALIKSLPPQLGRDVSDALARGVDGQDAHGDSVVIAAHPELDRGDGFGEAAQALGMADYAGAVWNPASTSNYQVATRGLTDITNIVIHDTEGSFSGAVSWFQNPAAMVSAHYVVRSSDGYISQSVAEKNVAWHDKCFNTKTIGIEHEGYLAAPQVWYTEPMYMESAKLTAYLCDKYGIAKEHGPIIGHGEAPDCSDHTDPGDGWNWPHYIDLVKTGGVPTLAAGEATIDAPTSMTSGEQATVTITITNNGNVAWDLDLTRLGTVEPQDRESALFVDGDWMSPNRATGADAHVEPGATGTFTFEIVAPDVKANKIYDEAFQLVQEGVSWFGPEIHVVTMILPRADDGHGGCAAGGSGSSGTTCGMVALGALVAVRRRRRRS